MNKVAILFLYFLSYKAFASSMGCFQEHVVTAKKLNLERKEAYKEISYGKTSKVSRDFILIQDVLNPISIVLDNMAKKRITNENPKFFCQEFVSMDETPEFSKFIPATTPIPEELKNKSYSSKELRERLKNSFEGNHYAKLLEQVEIELKRLEETPSYFCLTRHFLESIARASYFAQNYNDEQKAISNFYINIQIFGMRAASLIDKKAAPFQEKGIAIICQDIPKIPLN